MNKPEALRLAELLEQDPCAKAHHDETAAELRRLHAQRDALLEALKDIGKYTGEGLMYTTPWQDIVRSIGERARAAIKAVEETK